MDPLARAGLTERDMDIQPTPGDISEMHASTPHDGRYAGYTRPLRGITSEYQSLKRRLGLEIEYLIALGDEFQHYTGPRPRLIDTPFTDGERRALRRVYEDFSEVDFVRFKKIEPKTDHDVVAMNILALYNMGDIVDAAVMERALHFGRTSSDMDSNVFSLTVQEIVGKYYMPAILGLQRMFIGKAEEWHRVPDGYPRPFTVIAGQTHEQYAVPTPLRKVMANIATELDQALDSFIVRGTEGEQPFRLYGKMGGAVGNDCAMMAAYPGYNWRDFYRRLIESQGLEYQPATDQDESNMRVLELFDAIRRANYPLLKWGDDYSSYLSRGVLTRKTRSEVRGSSIMPQKVNPWKTEGAEVFLEFANAELGVYGRLARQRKQGDLTRSALKRYIGVPMGNIGIAIGRFADDLGRTVPNYDGIETELAAHPEISAASTQMILRAAGVPGAYDLLVEATKGKRVTPEMMRDVVQGLVGGGRIDEATGSDVVAVFTHERNIGDAVERADEQLGQAMETVQRLERLYGIPSSV
jgi:adenylosuccinate lyase